MIRDLEILKLDNKLIFLTIILTAALAFSLLQHLMQYLVLKKGCMVFKSQRAALFESLHQTMPEDPVFKKPSLPSTVPVMGQ